MKDFFVIATLQVSSVVVYEQTINLQKFINQETSSNPFIWLVISLFLMTGSSLVLGDMLDSKKETK